MSSELPIMTGAVSHPLVQRIIAYQRQIAAGDFANARSVFQPDVVYQVPGRNPLAGRYTGPDDVMGYFARLMELTEGSYRISHMQWFAGHDWVGLVTVNHADLGGRHLKWDELLTFRFVDGKKATIQMLQSDQEIVDAFLSHDLPLGD